MKILIPTVLAACTAIPFICNQEDGPSPRRPGDPPRDPFMLLFDTDEDDLISAEEITAATAVLRTLDRDGDGSLTRHELPRPPRPEDDRHDGDDRRPPRNEDRNSTSQTRPPMDDETDVAPGTVLLRNGYETDPQDGGRPVALIAAALGVKEQVFRDAFRNVQPSRFGPPSASRADANKKVLMDALSEHGVTNERLDEVSNYYRYRPQDDELWTVRPAKVAADIKDGQVIGFTIVDAGSGYMTAPEVVVAGHDDVQAQATIEFSKDLKQNGRITEVTLSKGASD